jgi:hypothetical protein
MITTGFGKLRSIETAVIASSKGLIIKDTHP